MNANIRVAVQALSRERNRIRLNADHLRRRTAPAGPDPDAQGPGEADHLQAVERNLAALDSAIRNVERLAAPNTSPGGPAT